MLDACGGLPFVSNPRYRAVKDKGHGVGYRELLSDLHLDDEAFEAELAAKQPAEKTYVVIFTPRSGSSWLTSVVSATAMLGYPEEYINEEFIRNVAIATNSKDLTGIIEILKRRRKTENSVFGIEATSTHIGAFGEKLFFETFMHESIFFNLWRRNIFAQGISLYRAMSTNRFHSIQSGAEPPPIDLKSIKVCTIHILLIEQENFSLLGKYKISAHPLVYEDIVGDAQRLIEVVSSALQVNVPDVSLHEKDVIIHKKIGDAWNEYAEHALRTNAPEFVDEIERLRTWVAR